MSTRPLQPPPTVPDDPGPWSGVLEVLQRRGGLPGRRRAEPPNGLMISPPPRTSLVLEGLESGATVAGAGPVRVVTGAREPALRLATVPGGVSGVSRMVRRSWAVPGLGVTAEERPQEDPAAGLEPDVFIDDLAEGDLPATAVLSPDGVYAAVGVVEPPRYNGLAIVRVSDRAVLRFIRFARCGAWSEDGGTLVVGGEWGLLALVHHTPPAE
ncbi:MAG: hypothetical protein U0237_06880 [Thermoleophilia bacterium]